MKIIVMAKAPLPGLAKTRLIPALGEQGSALLAQRLLEHSARMAVAANIGPVELCVSPNTVDPVWQTLDFPQGLYWSEQGSGDLGERLARVSKRVCEAGESVLLMGADCPALNSRVLQLAAKKLQRHDACLIPALDGGYVLLGLQRFRPELFENIDWSTERVAEQTRQRLQTADYCVAEMPPLPDIDTEDDLLYLPTTMQKELTEILPDTVS